MGYNNIFSFTFPVKNNSSIISLVRNLIQFYALISIYAKYYIIIQKSGICRIPQMPDFFALPL